MIYTTVCGILFSKIEHITNYQQSSIDKVNITSSAWQEIKFAKGSATLSINESPNDPGRLFTSNLSATLRDDFKTGTGILVISLTDGTRIVIGSQDIPAQVTKSVATYKTGIACNHNFYRQPLKAGIIS